MYALPRTAQATRKHATDPLHRGVAAFAVGTVRDMDVAAGAPMDGFTAFPTANAAT
jgi:hypothetical protein